MIHFIYKTYSDSGKYYIGRHSTLDINDGYLGSGKWVLSIKDKSKLKRKVLVTVDTFEELLLLEELLLSECITDPNNMNFNNRSCGWPTGNLNYGTSLEARKLKSIRKKGLTFEEQYGSDRAKEVKQKISKSKTGRKTYKPAWNRGLAHSELTKSKISSSLKETISKLNADERKELFGNYGDQNGFFNKTHSEDTIQHLKEKQKMNRQVNRSTCPHCNKTLDVANYSRYHGDKCKLRENNLPSQHSLTELDDQS